jgi:hypothetical protein
LAKVVLSSMMNEVIIVKLSHCMLKCVAFVGLVFLVAGCTQVPDINITGTWTGFVVFEQGDDMAGLSYALNLVLVQAGTSLAGQVGLQNALLSFLVPITYGDVSANSLSIEAAGSITLFSTTTPVAFTLTGSYSQSQMSGEGTYTVNGEVHHLTWSAQR